MTPFFLNLNRVIYSNLMGYRKEQDLNDWVEMLDTIYGRSQNYARSEYEILAHLSEVTGAFSKYLFKLNQPDRAREFLPKMFGWSVALLIKIKGHHANLEDVLLTKYPCVCPYCVSAPCACVPGQKKPIEEHTVRDAYHRKTPSQKRALNDFQMMFRTIYEKSWGFEGVESRSNIASERLQRMYTRLIEEISELGEAVRFAHLYPSNFDNELADYVAWLFAFVSCLHKVTTTDEVLLAENLFWPAYPGICMVCMLDICDCRPSPVRELLSKPALGDLRYIDGLTQAANKAQFDLHVSDIKNGVLPFPVPISAIRVDVDDFRRFNAHPFDHNVGDQALKHLVNVFRQKIRTRDRLYRVGGDEFALLCPDMSAAEAQGMMSRVSKALKDRPVPVAARNGQPVPTITLSIGVAECLSADAVMKAFDIADAAAIDSKNAGKDRISIQKIPDDAV